MNETAKKHTLSLADRNALTVTGVDEVISFDDTLVSMAVGGMVLNVSGTELAIKNLSLENGDVLIDGSIDALVYFAEGHKKKGLGRLFG